MKVLGITGGIGCGKSKVIELLDENYRCIIINTDQMAAELMKKGNVVYENVVAYFGNDILNEDGEINRKMLAGRVFKSELELLKLNSFTHPAVREQVLKSIDSLREKAKDHSDDVPDFLIIETALPYEARLKEYCDEIWYVTASLEVRRERLMENRNYSAEKITDIFNKQLSERAYKDFSDHVIVNDTTMSDILQQVQKILDC